MNISDSMMCPCCSGKLYVECCKQYIASTHDDFNKAMEKYEYIKAYSIAIANLADYLTKVKAHTVPLLSTKPVLGNRLLEIDIKAVEELTNKIFYVLSKRKISDNLEERFWTISNMVQDREWKELFQSYTLLYCDWFNKENQLHKYVVEIEVEEVTTIRLLQIIFSVLNYKYGIGKKLELANLIIQKTDNVFEQWHYRFSIALEYLVANDTESSKKYADAVIKELENYKIDLNNLYEICKSAEMYEIYGGEFDRPEYMKKALVLYFECLEKVQLNNAGQAMICKNIAYVYLRQGLYEEAINYFNKSCSYERNNFSLIYLAENYLLLGNTEKAESYFDEIDKNTLYNDVLDYYIVKAELFILTDRDEDVEDLIKEMKELDICKIPLYCNVFNNLISELQKGTEKKKGVWSWIRSIRKYLILQPNVYGMGIDFNKVIEDYENR